MVGASALSAISKIASIKVSSGLSGKISRSRRAGVSAGSHSRMPGSTAPGLNAKHKERHSPRVQAGKYAADQGAQQRACTPDHRDDAKQSAPPAWLEPRLNGEIAQRQQHAAADSLRETAREQNADARRKPGDEAAAPVAQCGKRQHAFDADSPTQRAVAAPATMAPTSYSRMVQLMNATPPMSSTMAGDDGGGDERVDGMQPDARAQYGEAVEQPRCVQISPGCAADLIVR
jgi:hypothetical protein